MTVSGAEAAGGPRPTVEVVAGRAPIPNPAEVAIADYYRTLQAEAQTRAPGLASADWADWPAQVEPATSVMPTLVRVGSVTHHSEQAPILIPAAGESHVLLGNPGLLEPTQRGKIPKGTGLTELKRVNAELDANYDATETHRLEALQDERFQATTVMRGIMLRTIATMRPGSVRVAVCDPNMGASFQDFSPLGNIDGQGHGLYSVHSGLHRYLMRLTNFIDRLEASGMQGASSVRELAAADAMTQPFILAVVLGTGQRMSEETAHLLRAVIDKGPAHGVTLLAHGLNFSSDVSPAHRIHPVARGRRPDRRFASSAAGNIAFGPDPSAPPTLVSATVRTIVNAERSRRINRDSLPADSAQALEPEAPAPTPVPVPETLPAAPPGVAYNRTVTAAARRAGATIRAVATYRAQFPLLEPGKSAALNRSHEGYLAYIDAVAANRADLRHDLTHIREGSILERLQTWAAADLVSDSPGDPLTKARRIRTTADNARFFEENMPGLIQTVAITAVHGREQLPENLRDWAAQDLRPEPPAYAFQLVADRATGNHSRVGDDDRHAQQALRATLTHLEHTYGVQLHEGAHVDQPMLEALVECEVARLYGADSPEVPNEVLDLLVRRSHRRLEAVNRDDLPPFAQQFYDTIMNRLQVIGRIDTVKEKAARQVQNALAAGGALISRMTSSDNSNSGGNKNDNEKAVGDPQKPTDGQPA